MNRLWIFWVYLTLLLAAFPVSQGFLHPLSGTRGKIPASASSSTWALKSTTSSSSRSRTIVKNPKDDDDSNNADDEEEFAYDKNQSNMTTNQQSARLLKARQLLEQLSKKGIDDDFVQVPPPKQKQPQSKRRSSTTTATKKGRSVVVVNNDDDAVVVPDNFWSNGHLDEQQQQTAGAKFVTRWKSGVNVAEPLIQYDPVAAEKLLFRQPTKWLVRNFQIAFPLGFWAVNVVFDYVLAAVTEEEAAKSQRRRARAQQLTKAISNLGPAIIKAGQALSSRPDLLPSEYLEELQKLQDDVPRFSNEVAFATVEEELEVDSFFDVFELVQEEPVAAASIGQVYKARLLANDDIVALKIQRPNCEDIIALDLYILRWWAGWYNKIFQILKRDVDVQSIIDDFGVLIYREIDYLAEAANAQRFNELYAGVTDVFVPKIYSDFSTSKVLTMEWVDGVRLTDQAGLDRFNLDASKLVNTLVECSMRQILENGFFHAGEYYTVSYLMISKNVCPLVPCLTHICLCCSQILTLEICWHNQMVVYATWTLA